jgi:Putative metallopeptidase
MTPICRVSLQNRPRSTSRGNPLGLWQRAGLFLHAVNRSIGWTLSLICLLVVTIPHAQAHPNRMLVDYVQPTNPAHQALYERLKERRALEKLQEIFSPFRLPVDLTLRTVGCDGVSNAWYGRNEHQVSVCYEYLHEIMQGLPKETTADGVTPLDAVMGQFFYVFAHEMGHAMFDILSVPVFGNAEDAADHFAAYIMLQFGRDQSRGLVTGAAYSYKKYVMNPEVTAPLAAFSDVHAAPAQRFYNLLCLAYGADPVLFADVVKKGYLPEGRARGCKREYDQVAFAFRDTIVPHLDEQLARSVLDKTWLPAVNAPSSHD